MSTESIKCANCGAPIRSGDSAVVATCPQCGAELTITRAGGRSYSSVQPNDPAYKIAADLRNRVGEIPYQSTDEVVKVLSGLRRRKPYRRVRRAPSLYAATAWTAIGVSLVLLGALLFTHTALLRDLLSLLGTENLPTDRTTIAVFADVARVLALVLVAGGLRIILVGARGLVANGLFYRPAANPPDPEQVTVDAANMDE